MTKGLSGTVEAARQASNLSKANVTVIDSDTTDQALSFQVIRAAQLAQEGKTLAEVFAGSLTKFEKYQIIYWCLYIRKSGKKAVESVVPRVIIQFIKYESDYGFRPFRMIPIVKGRGVKKHLISGLKN